MPTESIESLRARLEAAVRLVAPSPLTLGALVEIFTREHISRVYAERVGSSSATNWRDALAPLLLIYGDDLAETFGPIQLQAVRQWWIEQRLCRTTINERAQRIRRMIAWAVSHGWLPESQSHALETVAAVRRGRSQATEPRKVRPVPVDWIWRTSENVSPVVSIMLRVQYLTAMRPGEVVAMRGCDIDRSEDEWAYRPPLHKNAHRGKSREIWLGPQAIEQIHTRLRHPFIFTTRAGRPYRVLSYAQAIWRGAQRAGLPHWSPNQIRHTRLTELRRLFGREAPQGVAGHSDFTTTAGYADTLSEIARDVMKQVG